MWVKSLQFSLVSIVGLSKMLSNLGILALTRNAELADAHQGPDMTFFEDALGFFPLALSFALGIQSEIDAVCTDIVNY